MLGNRLDLDAASTRCSPDTCGDTMTMRPDERLGAANPALPVTVRTGQGEIPAYPPPGAGGPQRTGHVADPSRERDPETLRDTLGFTATVPDDEADGERHQGDDDERQADDGSPVDDLSNVVTDAAPHREGDKRQECEQAEAATLLAMMVGELAG